jgi:GR25 family glycosyltransferase involved in LPS biosynthesis
MIAKVINLNSRQDKWRTTQLELEPHFQVERVPAIRDDWGWLGLAKTFKQIFEQADSDVLIFEDDATYRGWATNLENAIKDLPEGWEMLMLGANIKDQRIDRINKNLARTYGAWTTHAIYYSHKLCKEMASIDLDLPIDEYFRTKVHPRGNSYVIYPFLSYQRPSESDIEGSFKDYTRIFEESEARVGNFVNQ